MPEGSVDAILNYCHNNLADNTLTTLLPYLQKKGVAVISASFSSMGLLTQKVGFFCMSSNFPYIRSTLVTSFLQMTGT